MASLHFLEGEHSVQTYKSGFVLVSRRTARNIEIILRVFCVLLTAAAVGCLAKTPDWVEFESFRDYRHIFIGLGSAALAWNFGRLIFIFVRRSQQDYPGCCLLLDLAVVVVYPVLMSLNPDVWGAIEPLPRTTMAIGVVICIFHFFLLLVDVCQGLNLCSGSSNDSWFPLHIKITEKNKRRDHGKGVDLNGSAETLPRFEAPIEMSAMERVVQNPELDSTPIQRPAKPMLVPPIDEKNEVTDTEPVSPSRTEAMTPPPRYSKKEEMASIELA